jgi:hypothetical protein
LFDWLRKLFNGKKKQTTIIHGLPANEVIKEVSRQLPYYIPKTNIRAVNQDISKFMKHGKQSKQYRKSIKAKIQPEED